MNQLRLSPSGELYAVLGGTTMRYGDNKWTGAAKNDQVRIWQETPGDFYSPAILETADKRIVIDVGGHPLIANVRLWHEAGAMLFTVPFRLSADWRYRVGCRVYLFLLRRVLMPLFRWLGRPAYMR